MNCGTVGCAAEGVFSCCGVLLCASDYAEHCKNTHSGPSDPNMPASSASAANKKQVGGTHYQMSIQPWDFVIANGIGFLEGNAIKYICRHRKTLTGKKDLEKAIHYLQKAIESYYSDAP